MQHWVSVIVGRADLGAPSAFSYSKPETEESDAAVKNDRGALSQRLGEALRGFFPQLASWYETSTGRARRREIEAFLSHATDIADLERRILELQRRRNLSHYS